MFVCLCACVCSELCVVTYVYRRAAAAGWGGRAHARWTRESGAGRAARAEAAGGGRCRMESVSTFPVDDVQTGKGAGWAAGKKKWLAALLLLAAVVIAAAVAIPLLIRNGNKGDEAAAADAEADGAEAASSAGSRGAGDEDAAEDDDDDEKAADADADAEDEEDAADDEAKDEGEDEEAVGKAEEEAEAEAEAAREAEAAKEAEAAPAPTGPTGGANCVYQPSGGEVTMDARVPAWPIGDESVWQTLDNGVRFKQYDNNPWSTYSASAHPPRTYRFKVAEAGRYFVSALTSAKERTEFNDMWIRFPHGGGLAFYNVRTGAEWPQSGTDYYKAYQNSYANKVGIFAIDHVPHHFATRDELQPGVEYTLYIAGRASQFIVHRLLLARCDGDCAGSQAMQGRLDAMAAGAPTACVG